MALTADDLRPLIEKLPRAERLKVAGLALRLSLSDDLPAAATDAERYAASPPPPDEFSTGPDDDPLAWDGEGWEQFG